MFKIIKKDKKTKARLGVLTTPHGVIKTPSYVFVGTYGKFLHLTPKDVKRTRSQLVIANTFHLWTKAIENKLPEGFIHKSFGFRIPVMTDSGGFQVLSLAFGDKNKVGKFMADSVKIDKTYKRSKIRITQKGVWFTWKGPDAKGIEDPRFRNQALLGRNRDRKLFLGPELSMKLQERIGADIIFAFDHITSPLDDFEYNQKAVELTDRWAKICLKTRSPQQLLFGIVQGGLFRDLRIKSAKSIGAMPFDGFGIGGSYTKKQISKILKWVIPYLPEEKPRHLLGVGKIEDVFEAIENGIDTFDCVIPTREARHGRLYTRNGHMDIRKGKYVGDKKIIEKSCGCLTCASGIPRSEIRALVKSADRELNAQGQRWCLMHNMWFFNNFLNEIRSSLINDSYQTYKKKFLKTFGLTKVKASVKPEPSHSKTMVRED